MNIKNKKIIKYTAFVIGGLLIGAILLGIINGIVGKGEWNIGWTNYRYDDTAYKVGEGSIAAPNVETIDLDWIDGNVSVVICQDAYISITETAPAIIDQNSFSEYLEQGPCLFIGDGAGKCADAIKHPNAHFCQCHPKASSMLSPALEAYKEKRFEDVAYFEPFYLKEFVATVSRKKLF